VFTLTGDSAGANLNIGVTMKCIELGIRPPDGLFLAYVPLLMSFVPSPSRLLCLMDPLLPFGFVMRCMKGMCFVCVHVHTMYILCKPLMMVHAEFLQLLFEILVLSNLQQKYF